MADIVSVCIDVRKEHEETRHASVSALALLNLYSRLRSLYLIRNQANQEWRKPGKCTAMCVGGYNGELIGPPRQATARESTQYSCIAPRTKSSRDRGRVPCRVGEDCLRETRGKRHARLQGRIATRSVRPGGKTFPVVRLAPLKASPPAHEACRSSKKRRPRICSMGASACRSRRITRKSYGAPSK